MTVTQPYQFIGFGAMAVTKRDKGPWLSPNLKNLKGLGPWLSPNPINLYGLGPWLSPNLTNLGARPMLE